MKKLLWMLLIALLALGCRQPENMKGDNNNGSDGEVDPDPIAPPLKDSFIKLTGGTFLMGSPDTELVRDTDEEQHIVTVSGFYISPYLVTQKEYMALMGNNLSFFQGDNLPVETVTWYNAVEYANKLSEKEGLTPAYTINGIDVQWDKSANGYRLPTEAEWEFAARAGTRTPFYTGKNITTDQANYNGRDYSYPKGSNKGVFVEKTTTVGNYLANQWGLYDMAGNVYEWCWNWYQANYQNDVATNPSGPDNGSERMFRGGCWSSGPDRLRSARRGHHNPLYNGGYLGFRLVRNV